jgi:hypothetical protein
LSITVPVSGNAISSSGFGIPVANTINGFCVGPGATNTGTITLVTTGTAVAGLAVVTFTLSVQTRVLITAQATFVPSGATASRMTLQAGYNSGSSAVIGSFTGVGEPFDVGNDGTTTRRSARSDGDVLLAAGTYTAYAACTRSAAGSASDTATNFYTRVDFCGYT